MAEEESQKSDLANAAVEVVKIAYDDALKPVAIETGKALGLVGRTVNVALAPLRGLVWSFEKIETWIGEKTTKILEDRQVPEEKVITPEPAIAVPVVEALRYTSLKDEFARLLATAMDSSTQKSAHPAFVEILKQMQPEEAQILQAMNYPRSTLRATGPDSHTLTIGITGHPPTARIQAGAEAAVYIQNLERLGILVSNEEEDIMATIRRASQRQSRSMIERLIPKPQPMRYFVLTELGQAFCKACIGLPEKTE